MKFGTKRQTRARVIDNFGTAKLRFGKLITFVHYCGLEERPDFGDFFLLSSKNIYQPDAIGNVSHPLHCRRLLYRSSLPLGGCDDVEIRRQACAMNLLTIDGNKQTIYARL